jgi:hypothetical protein
MISLHTSNRASNDQAVPSNATIPLGSNSLDLDILEPSLFEPQYVFFFLGKEHPHISEKSGHPRGWVDRANHTSYSAELQNPVCFLDSSLRVRPILDAGIMYRVTSQGY